VFLLDGNYVHERQERSIRDCRKKKSQSFRFFSTHFGRIIANKKALRVFWRHIYVMLWRGFPEVSS